MCLWSLRKLLFLSKLEGIAYPTPLALFVKTLQVKAMKTTFFPEIPLFKIMIDKNAQASREREIGSTIKFGE